MTDSAIVTTRNQREYSHEDKEGAFLLWRISCGRSIRKVAELSGINERTLYHWRDTLAWRQRADEYDNEDFGASRSATAAIVVNQVVNSVLTAVEIRDNKDNDPKVRLASAQWLAGLAGVSPVSKIETAVTDKREAVIEAAPDFSQMTVEQLREYELQHKRKRQIAQGDEPLPSPRMRT